MTPHERSTNFQTVSLIVYGDELQNKQQDIHGLVSERLCANALPPQE